MATVKPQFTNAGDLRDRTTVVSWTPLTENDTADKIEMPGAADRSVQITGTFAGGTVVIQGSNDGSNFSTLEDPQGLPLSFTSANIKTVLDLTRYLRPAVTSGTGVSVTITLVAKRY